MSQEKNSYYIGVDIGTESAGYAVTDTDYSLCKYKKKPMWGVNLFEEGSLRAERRTARTSRRRNERRKQRIGFVRDLFAEEIAKVDPDFFTRLIESALYPEDKSVSAYNISDPTIHHLIMSFINNDRKHDIRELYSAVAWLVAHRGHFLNPTDGDNVEKLTDIKEFYDAFMDYFEKNEYERPWDCDDFDKFKDILSESLGVSKKTEALKNCLFEGKIPSDEEDYPIVRKNFIKLMAGGKVKLNSVFDIESDADVKLEDEDSIEAALPELDDRGELLQLAANMYNGASLKRMLGDKKWISEVKVGEYNTHKEDLKNLKYLVKKYLSDNDYKEFFRKDITSAYSSYVAQYHKKNKDNKTVKKEDFYKSVKKLLAKIITEDPADKSLLDDINRRIDLGEYMPKQVDGDNRLIPQQLYYAELKKILENAVGEFPFLSEKDGDGLTVTKKLLSIFSFKIPYYVGPLNEHSNYAWIKKKSDEKILPWNFEKTVDTEECEKRFIRKMTNTCTYLPSEDVLPKNSLLYSKFTVLNEINNIKINEEPIDVETKQKIFEELFKRYGKVTRKKLENFLCSEGKLTAGDNISGIDEKINASLVSYYDFRRLLSDGVLSESDVEDIILHRTCTEDKGRFRKWLEKTYNLSENDLDYVAKLKYSDFGRVSEKFLNGTEGTCKETGEIGTVMYFLWNTNDNLMQILSDKYDFTEKINNEVREYYSENHRNLNERLDEMWISNSVKRPIFRTLDIVSDIVKAKGCPPEKIFIEMARGGKPEDKGKRTTSRSEKVKAVIKNAKELEKEFSELGENSDRRLQSEKLYLYFMQQGKCMYCGKRIELSELSTKYDVDHIRPRSLIKDDSFDNKVLVCKEENGRKSDNYPVPAEWRNRMTGFWQNLLEIGAISKTKFERLTRNKEFTAEEKLGFINRQLVETRQSTKAVSELLKEKYPKTEIVYSKAGLVSDFRHEYGEIKSEALNLSLTNEEKKELEIVKSRTANDTHHAHDAYLNIVVGNVYNERFTKPMARKSFNVSTDPYSLNLRALFGRKRGEYWNPEKHFAAIDKTMAMNFIRLTKYQTERKGSFFNILPIHSGEKTENLINRKRNLPAEKYGGYNKPTASFFVLAKYGKGKKSDIAIVGINLLDAKKFKKSKEEALNCVTQALPKGSSDVEILLGGRILKLNTVFSLDGFDVCLAGKTGDRVIFRSLMTPYYTPEEIRYIKKIENIAKKREKDKNYVIDERYDGISEEENISLYRSLVSKIESKTFAKLPGAKLCVLTDKAGVFENKTVNEQLKCLESMILYMKTNRAGECDMKAVGGKDREGGMLLSRNLSNWKYNDVRIVDRSASGLFEKRSKNLKELL